MSMEFTLNELQRQRVEDHLALVEQVLRRSIKTNETVDGMGHDDLYQEGCIALCPFSALLTASGDCESDGFILLPFLGGSFVRPERGLLFFYYFDYRTSAP